MSESFISSVLNFVLDRNNELPDKDTFPELQDFHAKNIRNLIFGHLNINSFHSKFMEVYEILSKRYMDIFAVNQTRHWLSYKPLRNKVTMLKMQALKTYFDEYMYRKWHTALLADLIWTFSYAGACSIS